MIWVKAFIRILNKKDKQIMRAIEIISSLREKYSNKYTRSPENNKSHYIQWLQDEYAELAMKQANGNVACFECGKPINPETIFFCAKCDVDNKVDTVVNDRLFIEAGQEFKHKNLVMKFTKDKNGMSILNIVGEPYNDGEITFSVNDD